MRILLGSVPIELVICRPIHSTMVCCCSSCAGSVEIQQFLSRHTGEVDAVGWDFTEKSAWGGAGDCSTGRAWEKLEVIAKVTIVGNEVLKPSSTSRREVG